MTAPGPEAGHHLVIAVRHGETAWSSSGRHTGWSDIPLNDAGRHQAALAGTRLSGMAFELVLVSPLGRAVETCRLSGFGPQAVEDPDLREWDYGAYDGLTSREINARRPRWSLWADGCPDGEDAAAVAARADRIVTRCRSTNGPTLLFAHGHLLRVLAARWVGAAPHLGASLGLSTAAVSVLGWERNTPVIIRWNDTTHLDPAGSLGLP